MSTEQIAVTKETSIADAGALSEDQIPGPSRLYNLAPIGVGTPLVEGLQSYIVRLARAHCVAPRVLLKHSVFPLLFPAKDALYMKKYTSYTILANTYNGMSVACASIVAGLEALTLRSDLRFLTMLPWQKGVAPHKMLRKNRVWCAACYQEWAKSKQQLYEPLLWSIEQVVVCPVHASYLESSCRTCGKEQSLPMGDTPNGYCASCKSMLGAGPDVNLSSRRTATKKVFRQDIGVAKQIGKLLAASPTLQTDSVAAPTRDFRETLTSSEKCREPTDNASTLDNYVTSDLPYLEDINAKPSLARLLLLCRHSNLSLVELLTGSTDYQNIAMSKLPKLPAAIPGRLAPVNNGKVREYLENALTSESGAELTVAEHAIRLGCARESLHRNFPDLCKAITMRSRTYRAESREKLMNSLVEQVRTATLEIYQSGEYPSVNRVSAYLDKAGCMRIPVVKAMWRETLGQLNLN